MERELGKSAEPRRGRSNGFDLPAASFDVVGYVYVYIYIYMYVYVYIYISHIIYTIYVSINAY